MTRDSQRGTVRDTRIHGASNAGLLVRVAHLLPARPSTSLNRDLVGAALMQHRSSALVPRYEIIPHCGVPIFSRVATKLPGCPTMQKHPPQQLQLPCHPTHHLGTASYPDWSSHRPFLAPSWLWFAQLFCKFSQQDTFATDQDQYRAGSAGLSSNQTRESPTFSPPLLLIVLACTRGPRSSVPVAKVGRQGGLACKVG